MLFRNHLLETRKTEDVSWIFLWAVTHFCNITDYQVYKKDLKGAHHHNINEKLPKETLTMIGGLSRTSRVKRVNMESSLFLVNDVIFRELWNSKSNYRDSWFAIFNSRELCAWSPLTAPHTRKLLTESKVWSWMELNGKYIIKAFL